MVGAAAFAEGCGGDVGSAAIEFAGYSDRVCGVRDRARLYFSMEGGLADDEF
jgi:hypothetical protein